MPAIALCQEESDRPTTLPDTLLVRKIEVPRSMKQLPAEEVTVLDTLTNPYALIYKQYGIVSIAVRASKTWDVWTLSTEESVPKEYSFQRIQLDGKGAEELLVKTTENDGRAGKKSGWSTELRYTDIWNLDTRELYISLQTLNKHHSWSAEYASDPTSSVPTENQEMVKRDNENKHSEIEARLNDEKIILTYKAKHGEEGKSFEYKYNNGYFVRQK